MTTKYSGESPSTVSAQIREPQTPELKFRSDYLDILENNKRIEVITQAEALGRLAIGGYEAVGHGTVKYLRKLPAPQGPIRRSCKENAAASN